MALSHSGHSYDRIEAVAESEKKDLLPLVEKAESAAGKLEDAMAKGEKSIQNIQMKKKSVDDAVNKCFKDLHEALERRKETLLAKSSEIELSKVTALKLQGEEMKKFYDEIVRVCGQIKEASEVYMPAEMLSAKGLMTEKLSGLLKLFDALSLDPCKIESESMTTDLNSSTITCEIEKFGVVTGGSCATNSTVALYMPQALKGKEKKVVLTTRDIDGKPFGRGGEAVQATMNLIGNGQEVTEAEYDVKDNKDGTYEICVVPQTIGEHQLSIKVENEHAKLSPFIVSVREPRNYTSLSGAQKYYSVSYPFDIAFDDNGTMFIADYSNGHIHVLNKEGSSFGSYGSGEGQLSTPRGICIDTEGRVYLSENSNNKISVFGADGTFDHIITGNMSSPWGIAFDPEGNIHVANHSSNTITVLSPDGNFMKQYGSGYLLNSSGIAIDPEGFVFVSEYKSSSSRLQIFSPQCDLVRTLSSFNYGVGVTLEQGWVHLCV